MMASRSSAVKRVESLTTKFDQLMLAPEGTVGSTRSGLAAKQRM